MAWNYRVVNVEGELHLYDVYYNTAGEPVGRSANPSHFYGDTVEQLKEQLEWFSAALEKPVLQDDEIGSDGKDASE
ncbi:hypothetical protein IGB42_01900 [Andreprevotia sp. IGB-42]|uniref:hypothetical protein n=1 Tax=Andreprevotia sp. IGB-42 TaxID=2497473 RepID=UPI001356F036|nr:hypothetical protein [Andreprevotia sp. IGB-42]KAF0813549.1 hypothetical protein IGB42_01900 [Andreprevotia sp. IGB-42]